MSRSRYDARVRENDAFMRAFYDAVEDIEKSFGVHVRINLFLSTHRGVLVLTMACMYPGQGSTANAHVRYTSEYPNSRSSCMEAWLFVSANSFSQQVTSWYADKERGRLPEASA